MGRMNFKFLLLVVLALLGVHQLSLAADSTEGFKRSRQEKQLAYYTGSATMTGSFVRRLDKESLARQGDLVCFFPKAASASLVPREKGDPRLAWFCFSNQKKAKSLLRANGDKAKGSCGIQGEATLVVTNYVANTKFGEVFDTARLTKIKSSTGPKPLACKK
jgi:hypothetical protein